MVDQQAVLSFWYKATNPSDQIMNLQLDEQVLPTMKNLKVTTEQEKGKNQRNRNEHLGRYENQDGRQEVRHGSRLADDVTSVSMENLTRSDGLLIAKQKWQLFLSPTNKTEHFPSLTQQSKPEPALTAIMFRIAQNRSTGGDPTSGRRTRPVGSRRLNVNSIRLSAYAARSERNANEAREYGEGGVSLGTVAAYASQITHVEAIAASELEKRRHEWLESEELRKDQERMKLQKKVNHFIAKVEEDKRKLIKMQNKALSCTIVGMEVRGRNKYSKAGDDDDSKNSNKT